MTPTDTPDQKVALDDMPNIVGTPGTSAYLRSLERLLKWYDVYFKTIRAALQAWSPNTIANRWWPYEGDVQRAIERLSESQSTRAVLKEFHDWLRERSTPPDVALQATQVPQWMPIETALKDGAKVLGMFLGEHIIMAWADRYKDWVSFNTKWYDGQRTVATLKDGQGNGGPDGWQPLPQPPREGG